MNRHRIKDRQTRELTIRNRPSKYIRLQLILYTDSKAGAIHLCSKDVACTQPYIQPVKADTPSFVRGLWCVTLTSRIEKTHS